MYSTYEPATHIVFSGLEEWEWLCRDTMLFRGEYVIHETSYGEFFPACDELCLDELVFMMDGNGGTELKIVFKVPDGRWEWDIVGEAAASVDSIGAATVIAAFKNKLMEFGLGGFDWQDAVYGPRVPWLIREDISPDSEGRMHLHDDWCYTRTNDTDAMDTSWPIASSNIITVGGPFANDVTEYVNDYVQAMVFTTLGAGFYGVTCWDKHLEEHAYYPCGEVGDRYSYAVITTQKDKNGTIIFQIYGCTGRDSYYAAKRFDEHKFELQHINLHVTDLILEIEYKDSDGDLYCHPIVDMVEKLGTISEKPQHDC